MPKEEQSQIDQRNVILRYLEGCPNASDTVDGVVDWWLPRQRYLDAREIVEQTLEILVREGLIEKSILPGNKVIYTCVFK